MIGQGVWDLALPINRIPASFHLTLLHTGPVAFPHGPRALPPPEGSQKGNLPLRIEPTVVAPGPQYPELSQVTTLRAMMVGT